MKFGNCNNVSTSQKQREIWYQKINLWYIYIQKLFYTDWGDPLTCDLWACCIFKTNYWVSSSYNEKIHPSLFWIHGQKRYCCYILQHLIFHPSCSNCVWILHESVGQVESKNFNSSSKSFLCVPWCLSFHHIKLLSETQCSSSCTVT